MSHPPFAVRVESNIQTAIRLQSVREGRPLPEIVEEAIREYLQRRGAALEEEDLKMGVRLKPGRRRREAWPDDEIVVVEDDDIHEQWLTRVDNPCIRQVNAMV
jgi:hypothetical protein